MTRKNLIILFTLFFISCSSLKVKEADSQNAVKYWEEMVYKSIDKEVYRRVNKCPSLISGKEKIFYRSELKFFPIKSTFQDVSQLANDLRLKEKTDTIVLVLSYPPFIGFDPLAGYKTKYYIQRNKDSSYLVRYSKEDKVFSKEKMASTEIKNKIQIYEKLKSGCGDGYFIVSYMTPELKMIKCQVILGLELSSG